MGRGEELKAFIFENYFLIQLKSVQNQTLELRLTMGQVELNIMGSLTTLQNCILMNVDDINDINALILVSYALLMP